MNQHTSGTKPRARTSSLRAVVYSGLASGLAFAMLSGLAHARGVDTFDVPSARITLQELNQLAARLDRPLLSRTPWTNDQGLDVWKLRLETWSSAASSRSE